VTVTTTEFAFSAPATRGRRCTTSSWCAWTRGTPSPS
jgi:hypothetical protein